MRRPARAWVVALVSGIVGACGPSESARDVEPPAAAPAALLSETTMLAAACSGCHAPSGDAIVHIADLDAGEISSALLAYKTEDGETVMHRLARAYTDAQIDAIAAHIAERAGEAPR